MANREVNLAKRVQTPHGARYCRVVLSANGRVKPDVVVVNGKEERHLEGAYYLEWREGATRVRLSVGKDAADASARRLRKEAELNAVNNGVAIVPENGDNVQRSVAAAGAEFLDETKLTKKPKTLAAYTTALNHFTKSCPKLYVHDIERRDMLKFSAFLRDEKNQSPRSVYNKFENVMSFLKTQGIRGLVRLNGKSGIIAREVSRNAETFIFRDREGKLLLVQLKSQGSCIRLRASGQSYQRGRAPSLRTAPLVLWKTY